MRIFESKFGRPPLLWFLLGLLFVAAGLFLGFDYGLTFGYFLVGLVCCGLGVILFILHVLEPPGKPESSRLSPNFISAGATVAMPPQPQAESESGAEQAAAE